MSDGETVQAQLESAEQAIAEHRTLSARRDAATRARQDADRAVGKARARLDVESAQVAGLEGFSPARIWAAVTGSRLTRLETEQAEKRAAEYAAAAAEAGRDTVQRELDEVGTRIDALGDTGRRRTDALQAKEDWLRHRDGGPGVELDALATKVGAARELLRQIGEAREAARTAADRLATAAEKLGSAQSWSAYDTFFGGGLMADAVKYDRIDEASHLIRSADEALRRLGTELADVGQQAVGGVVVDGMTRTFDVWLDNIFSDWAVHDRIQEATGRVAAARQSVDRVWSALEDDDSDTRVELDRLSQSREKLLLRE